MIRKHGNMFDEVDFSRDNVWLATTTNNVVTGHGLVMGGGHALEVVRRYPDIDHYLGSEIFKLGPTGSIRYGLIVSPKDRVLAFQTKGHYRLPSTIDIIESSCAKLKAFMDEHPEIEEIHLPMPGVGLGGLRLADVEPVLGEYMFDDRLVVWTM